jgi:septal ring factor EnvC (AmiA/AmiB activator)
MKNITNILGKPAGWMYFILVVALLIIISSNSTEKANLQADLDNAIDEISALETSLEASANEIAVRDDAIAGWESEVAAVNAKLNDTDVLRGDLELENVELALTVADLQSQVDASAIALEDAIANPNCPVTQ